ncbi:hypothetical protein C8J57DRAFT_1618189 [Mycena rebaudengoi]|nr:hypothetical protein C8J57DRAFT_1618189 [Mycena rebaudengoi]
MDGLHAVDVASMNHSGLKPRFIHAIARVRGANGRHIRSGIEALHRASKLSPESHRKMENWQRKSEGSLWTIIRGPIPSANPKLKHFRRSCLTRGQVAHYLVWPTTQLPIVQTLHTPEEARVDWGTLGARAAGGRSLREGTNLEQANNSMTLGPGLEERTTPSSQVGVTCASLATPPRCSNSARERNAGMNGAVLCRRANHDWIRKTLCASTRECIEGSGGADVCLVNCGRLTEHAASQPCHGSQYQRTPQARMSKLELGHDWCTGARQLNPAASGSPTALRCAACMQNRGVKFWREGECAIFLGSIQEMQGLALDPTSSTTQAGIQTHGGHPGIRLGARRTWLGQGQGKC